MTRAWIGLIGLIVPLCVPALSHAQVTLEVLATFEAPYPYGARPAGPPLQVADGSFYGTTPEGGAFGHGTIYKIDTAGTLTAVHSFDGSDGSGPGSGLVQAADGTLYGTTESGGAFGGGTVFRFDPAGSFTIIHHFDGGADQEIAAPGGHQPNSLIRAADGTLYGTTRTGGVKEQQRGGADCFCGYGTVFMIDASATALITLHRFTGGDAGGYPHSLLQGSDGSLYGVTEPSSAVGLPGTVFRIDASGQLETLYRSTQFAADSLSTVLQASDGSFYGTNASGVYKLEAAGTLTPLYRFELVQEFGIGGGVIEGADGAFYGVTLGFGPANRGLVFRLAKDGTLTVVYRFTGDPDYGSVGGLSRLREDVDGRLYGTMRGPAAPGTPGLLAPHMIFRLTPPVNAAPVAHGQSTTTRGNRAVSIVLSGEDADGDPLTFSIASGPAHGMLSGTAPHLTYTPALNYRGADSFTFTVSDGTTVSAPATVAITVTVANRSPVPLNGTLYVQVPTPASGTLVATDSDGDVLTYALARQGKKGIAVLTNPATGAYTYTPYGRQGDTDTFTFTAHDGIATSIPGTITVTFAGTGLNPSQPIPVPGQVEAEDYDLGGPGIAYLDTSPGNEGGAYRADDVDVKPTREGGFAVGWFAAHEWLAYTLNVTRDDSYTIRARVGSPLPGRTFHLEIDGRAVTGAIPVPLVADWDRYGTVRIRGLVLRAGVHVVKVVMGPEDYMDFQGFAVLPDSYIEEVGGHAVPGTIEAADYDRGGSGVSYYDSTPGCYRAGFYCFRPDDVDIKASPEGGYAIGYTTPGEWLAYTLEVAVSGLYTIQTRIGAPLVDRTFYLEIDGRRVTGAVPVPVVSDWGYYGNVSVPGIALEAGTHVMRIVVGANADMDIKGFTILPDPPARVVPGRLEAEDYDSGGAGVGYGDATPGNDGGAHRLDDVDLKRSREGGVAVGWMNAGEWLAYTVDVAAGGAYSLHARVGSMLPGRTFHIEVDGQDVTGPLAVPQFADWDQYETVRAPNVQLSAGRHVLRVVMGPADYMDFDALTILAGEDVIAGGPPQWSGAIEFTDELSPNRRERFTFVVPERQRIVLQATSTAFDPCLRVLYEASGQPVAAGRCGVRPGWSPASPAGARLDLTLAAGTYVVEVYPGGYNPGGAYRLQSYPVLADTPAAALVAGAVAQTTLKVAGQLDLYTFALAAPTQVRLLATTPSAAAVAGWLGVPIAPCIRVLRIAGEPAVGTDSTCSRGYTELDQMLGAGTYFVEISDWVNRSAGEYRLLFEPR